MKSYISRVCVLFLVSIVTSFIFSCTPANQSPSLQNTGSQITPKDIKDIQKNKDNQSQATTPSPDTQKTPEQTTKADIGSNAIESFSPVFDGSGNLVPEPSPQEKERIRAKIEKIKSEIKRKEVIEQTK